MHMYMCLHTYVYIYICVYAYYTSEVSMTLSLSHSSTTYVYLYKVSSVVDFINNCWVNPFISMRNISMRKNNKMDLLESLFDLWRTRTRLWLVGKKLSVSPQQAANLWGCLLHMSLVGLQTWLYFFHVGDPLGLILIASRRRPWPKCNRWNFLPLSTAANISVGQKSHCT